MAHIAYLVEQFDANCLVPETQALFVSITICEKFTKFKIHKLHDLFRYKGINKI